jgi:ferritin-like metal-binding protein YciE
MTKLEQAIKEIKSKIDADFDYEVEPYEIGSYDDIYDYGVATGEQLAYSHALDILKQLLKEE